MRRLDLELLERGYADSRRRAQELIRGGLVQVGGEMVTKPARQVESSAAITVSEHIDYVSRSAYKLAAANRRFEVDFQGTVVLDVGASTGGFSDYALRFGAKRVLAVDVGTHQLRQRLRTDPRIDVYEKTDIRDFRPDTLVDIALIDVSFISLRQVIPNVAQSIQPNGHLLVLCKPQFEAGAAAKHKGVIKNERLRRQIFRDFEAWLQQQHLRLIDKADTDTPGSKGNRERFYWLDPSA